MRILWFAVAGCSPTVWSPAGRPDSAEGVVLLAELSADNIFVDGVLDSVPQRVDLDAAPDDRYGFRYRVLDADGEVLTERTTVGPALVEAFLDYWSGVSGIEILDNVPTLGRFPLVVPVLPDAALLELEVRGEDGEYVRRGLWDYDRLDDPREVIEAPTVSGTEILLDNGDPDHRLDLVVLSDGYRAEDMAQYREDADRVVAELVKVEPFATYADRINVVRLDLESVEAGASYDCSTCGFRDTALGSIFAIELANRFAGGSYDTRAIFQADQWRLAAALSGVPWDAAVVLVNSQKFGAMAVHFATVTRGVGDMGETAVHELGHSVGLLGDEYTGDACIRSAALGLPENVTDTPEAPPWSDRVEDGTPLPTPPDDGYGIGAYAEAWNCEDLFRPAQSCRMNVGGPFCDVCSELVVRRLLRFVDPAESVTLDGRDLVIEGALPDTSVAVWVDGEPAGEGTTADPPTLPRGGDLVEVELTHHSAFVGRDPTGDLSERWTFGRTATSGR